MTLTLASQLRYIGAQNITDNNTLLHYGITNSREVSTFNELPQSHKFNFYNMNSIIVYLRICDQTFEQDRLNSNFLTCHLPHTIIKNLF